MTNDPWGDVRGAREAASVSRESIETAPADRLIALLDLPVTGGKTVRDLTDSIGRGAAQ